MPNPKRLVPFIECTRVDRYPEFAGGTIPIKKPVVVPVYRKRMVTEEEYAELTKKEKENA